MIKPAIVAVGYNRPDGMRRLLESIGKAKYEENDIPLIVSIDESDRSNEVEQVAKDFRWEYGPKEIRRFPERQGLRKHIVQCGDLSEKYGGVIILEDDLIVAEDFYSYVCQAHEAYDMDKRVCGVALYAYSANVFTHFPFQPIPSVNDVYLGDMVVTWGQSWSFNQWRNFKTWYLAHEDKLPPINPNIPRDISGWTRSWGRYFVSYMADQKKSYIYPYTARSTCFSDFGEHNKKASIPFTFVQVPLMHGIPDHYHLGEYETLHHYDSFYEYVPKETETIYGLPGNMICFDLNNMKTSSQGKKYVVTNSKIKALEITSFGMTLHPMALNVIEEVPGNQLHLYELNNESDVIRPWNGNRPKYHADHRRLKYEFFDVSWRFMRGYAVIEFMNRVRDKLKK